MNDNEIHGDDRLRQVLRTCADTQPPPGARQRVWGRVQARLEGDARWRLAPRPQRRRAGVLLALASAATAAAAMVPTVWLLAGGGVAPASANLSEMLRHLRESQSVCYELTIQRPGRPVEKARVRWAGARARTEWRNDRTVITDGEQGRMLSISPATREAKLMDYVPRGSDRNFLRDLLEATASGATRVARESTAGREMDVFRIVSAQGELQVWVDAKGNLPVRVQLVSASAPGTEIVQTLSRIQWDAPIEESLFRLEAPPGYKVERVHREPGETDPDDGEPAPAGAGGESDL